MPEKGATETVAYDKLSEEERAEVLRLCSELFGIEGEADPLIDMPMIAKLAGVADGTPGAWQQRTREGKELVPFPAPDDHRYKDKPQWRAVSLVERFLKPSKRWPRGVVARPNTRRERPATRRAANSQAKVGLAGLRHTHPDLAEQIRSWGLDDGRITTVAGWRNRLSAAAKAAQNA